MEELRDSIGRLIIETIPDINQTKATLLAEYLVSEDVGVRSMERLFNVSLENIKKHVSECDADILYRSWQENFRPKRPLREQQRLHVQTYQVKWDKIPNHIIDQLEKGTWLSKNDRCLLVRLVVSDVLREKPKVPRTFFQEVARTMVRKYPTALHDRQKTIHDCNYLEQKLKFRYDEETRAYKVKSGNEAPNIPQAYGCVRWKVKMTAAEKEDMIAERSKLEAYYEQPPKEWSWEEIISGLRFTYPLQREDINSQVPKRKPRARGRAAAEQQEDSESTVTTKQLFLSWPFLFHNKAIKVHFQILTNTDWDLRMDEFKEKFDLDSFIKFLSTLKELDTSDIRKKYKKAKKHDTCKSPELIALILMLIQYFKEDTAAVLIEAERTLSWEQVDDQLGLPSTPCIISLGPLFKAKKHFFSVDEMVVSSMKDFKHALASLFCAYFVLNIKYAEKAGCVLDFLQRIVAKIEPEKGTKMRRTNYKQPLTERLQTLLDKHAVWQNKVTNENENPNGEEEDMGDP